MIYLLTQNGRPKQIRRFVQKYALSLTTLLLAPDIKILRVIQQISSV